MVAIGDYTLLLGTNGHSVGIALDPTEINKVLMTPLTTVFERARFFFVVDVSSPSNGDVEHFTNFVQPK
jgi:hypothetical protein